MNLLHGTTLCLTSLLLLHRALPIPISIFYHRTLTLPLNFRPPFLRRRRWFALIATIGHVKLVDPVLLPLELLLEIEAFFIATDLLPSSPVCGALCILLSATLSLPDSATTGVMRLVDATVSRVLQL